MDAEGAAFTGIPGLHLYQPAPTGEPRPLTRKPAMDALPKLTTDGKRLAFSSNRSGNLDVWLKDLETGKEQALTVTPTPEYSSVLSPDGSKAAYLGADGDRPAIFVAPVGAAYPKKSAPAAARPMAGRRTGTGCFMIVPGDIPAPAWACSTCALEKSFRC